MLSTSSVTDGNDLLCHVNHVANP